MGAREARTALVQDLNHAFHPTRIRETVGRLRGLSPRADFLAITRALGILGEMDAARFRRYRGNLPIPRLIQRILTLVHHYALTQDPPIPMRFEINDSTPPGVEIIATDELITIKLSRPDPVPRPRRS